MPTKSKPIVAPAAALPKAPSKSALVLKLLARARGATIAEMAEPTSWQPHSTRAFLSGLRKQGRTVIREQRKTGETAYRIGGGASPKGHSAGTPVADGLPLSSISNEASAAVGGIPSEGGARVDDSADAEAAEATPAAA